MTPAELRSHDATELARRVQTGEMTAIDLITATLANIAVVEPDVNAFRVVMSDAALAGAARIDELSVHERRVLPLAGVPVAIKDDTDVAGQSTMWGTSIDRGVCAEDAEIVDRLCRAGAIVIGKTNVPELTLWPWTSSTTWGTTRNPWSLGHTPGGSSGGSAVAVCTGMAAMAIGSDGGGSVRYPAALTGLVGLKPQRDRLPLGPEHGSGWHGLIALGPLTRSVRDAALFLDVTAGDHVSNGFRRAIDNARRPLRIAVAVNPPRGSQVSLTDEGRRTIDDACELITSLGHDIVEAEVDYPHSALRNATIRLLRGVHDDVAMLPDRGQLESRTRAVARLGRTIPGRILAKALARETELAHTIGAVFDDADVVMTPLCESPAPLLKRCPSRGAVRSLRAANTSAWLVPWNVTGQPALALPTGVDVNGLPTAVQLVGRSGDESTLLGLAAEVERSRPFPVLQPSAAS